MHNRILVLSAAVGAGHMRAAQAVELALRELAPAATVRNVDVLELTNASFRGLYGKAYLDLIRWAPHVLGYFYDLMDKPRSESKKSDRLRSLVERLNLRKLTRLLEDEPWDVVVNTHFLPAELIARLKAQGRLCMPHLTVTTDFETHRLWVNQPCEHYCTATEEGAAYLEHWGVPRSDLTVTGIPIHPVFSQPVDRAACLARHGLPGDRPIVLQLAGGFGVGPVEQLLDAVTRVETPLDIVLVCGKNAELKDRMCTRTTPGIHRVQCLGFTDKIDELMGIADVVLTKPGGLTTSEALARGVALVIVNPIPGQETRNSDYLLENGAAIKINNLGTAAFKLAQLLADPARIESLKSNSRRLARPRAAYDVAHLALNYGLTQ